MKKAASVSDILGLATRPRIPTRWATHYRELCRLRDQFDHAPTPKDEAVRTDDIADAGAAEIDINLERTTLRAAQETQGEIFDAIRRIEKGTYGICEITGEAIETERLQATPWARYSLKGRSELEKTKGNTHARLGELRSVIVAADSAEDDDSEGVEEKGQQRA